MIFLIIIINTIHLYCWFSPLFVLVWGTKPLMHISWHSASVIPTSQPKSQHLALRRSPGRICEQSVTDLTVIFCSFAFTVSLVLVNVQIPIFSDWGWFRQSHWPSEMPFSIQAIFKLLPIEGTQAQCQNLFLLFTLEKLSLNFLDALAKLWQSMTVITFCLCDNGRQDK